MEAYVMRTIAEIKRESSKPWVVANHRGVITEVSDSFGVAFGWDRAEIVGKNLDTIIPRRLRDTHRLGFSRFLRTGRPTIIGQPLELKVASKDGRELTARHVISAEQVGGQWMFAATIE